MNDPIINAPISKIVEAISNEGIIEDCCNNAIGSGIAYNRITEALASLGGEEDSIKGYLERIAELKTEISELKNKSSEREVLSGEQFYEKFREVRNELSAVTGTYSLSEAIIKTYDRYIAEKQSKTEEKLYCHHNGKYTLKEDGTCCKCHLPLAEKGGEG